MSIDSDFVGGQAAERFSTSAAAAIAVTATATIPADRKRGVCNAVKPIASINKASKEDSITGIASGGGGICSYAA